MMHLLLPSTVTRKLLIAQASYCRITKLRARLTPKCKKLNIRKCRVFADRVTYVCVCVCICVCVYVCQHVCMYGCVGGWVHVVRESELNIRIFPFTSDAGL